MPIHRDILRIRHGLGQSDPIAKFGFENVRFTPAAAVRII